MAIKRILRRRVEGGKLVEEEEKLTGRGEKIGRGRMKGGRLLISRGNFQKTEETQDLDRTEVR